MMRYYGENEESTIQCDANRNELGYEDFKMKFHHTTWVAFSERRKWRTTAFSSMRNI